MAGKTLLASDNAVPDKRCGAWPVVIGLDSNLLIRYLMQDDPVQSRFALYSSSL